ncbi:MAG: sulfite exporter TauE/SafE family protein [Desulfobulbus sp.]|jgi:uncharacterized membrane protein YfcA|nr:sulfite exporter TauE/SafE family protein [Desulfobulbus sp.]
MELVVVCLAALLASGLTLFSGFGLGTLLMPVFALFVPLELAVAMTAIVHLANNLFKIGLLGRMADWAVVLRFGLPAVVAAFAGALLLFSLDSTAPLASYQAFGRVHHVFLMGLVIGALILVFVVLELLPAFSRVALDRRWLPVGGLVSGFFGGVSGHQGAFRSMFLIKAGLGKEAFIATGVVLAVIVDMARLVVYGFNLASQAGRIDWLLVAAASGCAFAGAYGGKRLLKRMTFRSVQWIVSAFLVVVAIGLMSGLL